MALGKQIKLHREHRGWTLLQLSDASNVDVGTISALELRDSSRSKYFPALAKAFGLTLEQLADETRLLTPDAIDPVPTGALWAKEPQPPYLGPAISHDKWTAEAIAIMKSLDPDQRQGMVARMREFQQYLGPPRNGQALSVAG